MTRPLTITGIAGSLRSASYSRTVLQSIGALLPEGTRFETFDIGALPHYNEDLDNDAAPEAVVRGRAQIAASDAVIIVTPEFNHGVPGVLKNTLDWFSRPAFKSPFIHKPVMFATISPGALGGVRTQSHLREALASMLCRLVPLPEIAVTHVGTKVAEGRLTDEPTLKHIGHVLSTFLADFARA
ncbi:MAG TPA: NADPH-dependent FMN reductase [Acidocella sp.]|jgi:chromate reductase|nr:NADPH-dependent FMN reductase [Acidocella sp.]